MKNQYGVRRSVSSATSLVRSVVSMMSESVGLGLAIACVVVLLAGPGARDVVEHRSVAAAERTSSGSVDDSMRITSWKKRPERRNDRGGDRLSYDWERGE